MTYDEWAAQIGNTVRSRNPRAAWAAAVKEGEHRSDASAGQECWQHEQTARDDEREACARVAESCAAHSAKFGNDSESRAQRGVATAIRNRPVTRLIDEAHATEEEDAPGAQDQNSPGEPPPPGEAT